MQRRQFIAGMAGMSAALATANNCFARSAEGKSGDSLSLYWGDFHSHCGISYGQGTLENAFKAASEHLDFCSVVGHASWHDTPTDPMERKRLGGYIKYHDKGFAKLAGLWPEVKSLTRAALVPGKFIPFLSFEWHSTTYGDHVVYYQEPEGEIVYAGSIRELRDKLAGKKVIIIPHHPGFLSVSRGVDWNYFETTPTTPFVEVYSKHGCSVSTDSPWPMLGEMGPRSYEGTAHHGLSKGHQFGMVCSTDGHNGYPGSYGLGLMGVYAASLTAASLWEGFSRRRVYGVTGDRMMIDFRVNDGFMGENIPRTKKRRIEGRIEACDFVESIDVIRGCEPYKRFIPPRINPKYISGNAIKAKVRIEWGWGVADKMVEYSGKVSVTDGAIRALSTCFTAQPMSQYKKIYGENADDPLIHRILEKGESFCTWQSYAFGNSGGNPRTSALILTVEMAGNGRIEVELNGTRFSHTLEELLQHTVAHSLGGFMREAVVFHQAVPEKAYSLKIECVDEDDIPAPCHYYLNVRQKNGQQGWSSPVFLTNA